MEFVQFIKVLLRRKLQLIIIPIIGMIMAGLLTMNSPKVYVSEATIASGILDDTKISIEENIVERTSSYVTATRFGNLIQTMKSKSVIDLVSYELLRHDITEPVPFRPFTETTSRLLGQYGSQVKETLNQVLALDTKTPDHDVMNIIRKIISEQKYAYNDLMKKLSIERMGESNFIKTKYESENSLLSAFVLNTLFEKFDAYNRKIQIEKSSNSIDFFRKLAEEKKAEVDVLVDRMKQYKLDNKIINLYEQTKSLVNQISEQEIIRENENKKIPSLTKAINEINKIFTPEDRRYYEAEYSKRTKVISKIKDNINRISEQLIAKNYNDPALSDSLNYYKSQLRDKLLELSENAAINPNATKQDLVDKKINFEIELEIAKQSVISMDTEIRRLKTIAESFAPSEASISGIEREISVAVEAYLVILNKLNLAKFTAVEINDGIQLTEPAFPADKAQPNKNLLLIILVGFISFFLTIVAIFILEYIDLTLQTPARFKKFTGLATIGDINYINSGSIDIKSIFSHDSDNTELSYFRNAVRNLRYNMQRKSDGAKIFLIASTIEKTGKTFLVTILSYAFRLVGKKVLIIDANNINNTLSERFQAEGHLPDVLSGNTSVEQSVDETSVEGIDCLGTGKHSLTPAEMIHAETFPATIQHLKSIYDVILIESPAMNKHTTTKELLGYVDELILVFSASTSLDAVDKRILQFIKDSGVSFSCVLNKIANDKLEEIQGESQKKRSVLRKFIKKIIKRNLTSRNDKNINMNLE